MSSFLLYIILQVANMEREDAANKKHWDQSLDVDCQGEDPATWDTHSVLRPMSQVLTLHWPFTTSRSLSNRLSQRKFVFQTSLTPCYHSIHGIAVLLLLTSLCNEPLFPSMHEMLSRHLLPWPHGKLDSHNFHSPTVSSISFAIPPSRMTTWAIEGDESSETSYRPTATLCMNRLLRHFSCNR